MPSRDSRSAASSRTCSLDFSRREPWPIRRTASSSKPATVAGVESSGVLIDLERLRLVAVVRRRLLDAPLELAAATRREQSSFLAVLVEPGAELGHRVVVDAEPVATRRGRRKVARGGVDRTVGDQLLRRLEQFAVVVDERNAHSATRRLEADGATALEQAPKELPIVTRERTEAVVSAAVDGKRERAVSTQQLSIISVADRQRVLVFRARDRGVVSVLAGRRLVLEIAARDRSQHLRGFLVVGDDLEVLTASPFAVRGSRFAPNHAPTAGNVAPEVRRRWVARKGIRRNRDL